MLKPPTIRSVSQSMSIETKNHASPSVRTANGSVSSLSSGLRIVFSTPNTAAAQTSVQFEPSTVTPLRSHAVTPSATAFATHETSIHLITAEAYGFGPAAGSPDEDDAMESRRPAGRPARACSRAPTPARL